MLQRTVKYYKLFIYRLLPFRRKVNTLFLYKAFVFNGKRQGTRVFYV